MAKKWIDFKELRERLDFKKILEHYRVDTGRAKGVQLSCFCPLPSHDGQKRSPSFSAQLKKGIFNCFGCGAKGNMLEFAVLMDGGEPDDGKALRATALKLAKVFGISTPRPGTDEKGRDKKRAAPKEEPAPTPSSPEAGEPDGDSLPVEINAPLTFELKSLDRKHGYFASRGIALATAKHFGLGYCAKGLMKGRIAIPVHDADGLLVAYAGRLVDKAGKRGKKAPKYFFPPPREVDGIRFEFHKSELLYNGHDVGEPADELLVVEGFSDVWHLWQHGYENVCALMGSDCSDRQAELILSHTDPDGQVRFLFDADKAGRRCARRSFMKIGQHRPTRWTELPDGSDPADIEPEALAEYLE